MLSISRCATSNLIRQLTITFTTNSGETKELAYDEDQNLFEVLTEAGFMKKQGTCMGNVACGKCQVKHVGGTVTEADDDEKDLLGDAPSNIRIACAIALDAGADKAQFQQI